MTKEDLSQIKTIVEEVVEQKLKPINKSLKKLQDGQNIILKYVDSQDSGLEKRVVRIENHLGLSPSRI